jgi:8-oxo-dGTP pyrophosphatase MutT (NUDIX family)
MLPVKKVIRKTGKGTQYAALCFRLRKNKKVEILLVTSRRAGRWIPPKGWPMKGKKPQIAAAVEAHEEAGVKGQVFQMALGRYRYGRDPGTASHRPAEAFVFPLEVESLDKDFKEKGQRRVKWFSPKRAAMMVREPKLKKIIREFDPAQLPAR